MTDANTPSNLNQVLIRMFWKSKLGRVFLFFVIIVSALFIAWNSIPEDYKLKLLEGTFENPERNIKYRYDLIEILKREEVSDFSLYQEKLPKTLLNQKVSPVKRTFKLTIKKKSKEAKTLYRFYYTAGLTPDIAVLTGHKFKVVHEKDFIPPKGYHKLNKYRIEIDIDHEYFGKEFSVNYQVITWNDYQIGGKELGALVKHETDTLIYRVRFPMPIDSVSLYIADYETLSREELNKSECNFINQENKYFTWFIEHPKNRKAYMFNWEGE